MFTTASAPVPALTLADPASRGQTMPCPCCGEADATIDFNLADAETLHCQECDANFSVADVRHFLTKWGRLLLWIDAMPAGD
jgi:hypothetical protein